MGAELSSTVGIVALAAAAVAIVAVAAVAVLYRQVRRLRADQRVVMGDHSADDLVGHAATLDAGFRSLHAYVTDVAERLDGRMGVAEARLDSAISYCGLIRYDAYNEMSGRQSTSIALLDSARNGVVLSSIHHRDQARLYAKQVSAGKGELKLSPEEEEALRLAMTS
jgi:predicted ABC-class ATPase